MNRTIKPSYSNTSLFAFNIVCILNLALIVYYLFNGVTIFKVERVLGVVIASVLLGVLLTWLFTKFGNIHLKENKIKYGNSVIEINSLKEVKFNPKVLGVFGDRESLVFVMSDGSEKKIRISYLTFLRRYNFYSKKDIKDLISWIQDKNKSVQLGKSLENYLD